MKPRSYASMVLAFAGLLLIGMGLYFMFLRPPLLPEDLRYMRTSLAEIEASLPGLLVWLRRVFWVMGGAVKGGRIVGEAAVGLPFRNQRAGDDEREQGGKRQDRCGTTHPPDKAAKPQGGTAYIDATIKSVELLKELHILTREGRLNQDSRRKLKQIYHLFQFIEKLLLELTSKPGGRNGPVTLADHGAGKSYLGFILYDLFFKHLPESHIYGVETRAELVSKSRDLALRLGFDRMSFLNLSVAEATGSSTLPQRIDVVTALHACDTATDDAIEFGLHKQASFMVLVPCCQAEMARVLNQHKALSLQRSALAELWRHPLHTREMGSQLTNVLRCLYLEALGYQVTVTELVGWEHSMKNELILARYTGQKKRQASLRLHQLLEEFGLLALRETRFTRLPAVHDQQISGTTP